MLQGTTPGEVAVYVIGVVITVPTLVAAVKLIYFVAEARTELKASVGELRDLKEAFGNFKHEIRNVADVHDKRILLVERDVEHLKESAA